MSDKPHQDIRRTLLLLRRDNEVLLAMKKRGFGQGKWNGVGGKIEPNETLEDALVRECQEEINVTPTSWRAVAELDFVQDAETDEPWHMFVYAYIADAWEGEPSESEEMQPAWYDIEAIPYDSMWDDDQYWLPLVLRGDKVIGNFTFDIHDHLMTHDIQTVESLPHATA